MLRGCRKSSTPAPATMSSAYVPCDQAPERDQFAVEEMSGAGKHHHR